MFPSSLRRLVILSALISAAASSLSAATYSWDGGGVNTNFSTPENWSTDVAAESASTTTLFFGISPAPASYAPNVDAPFTLNSLQFQSNATGGTAWTMTGSAITFISNGVTVPTLRVGTNLATSNNLVHNINNDLILTNDLTVSVGSGNNATELRLNGTISGAGSLSWGGTLGTLRLTGANDFSGGVGMSRGNMYLSTNTSMGTGTLRMAGTSSFLIAGANNDARVFANDLSLGTGVSSVRFQNNLTFDGDITVGNTSTTSTAARTIRSGGSSDIVLNGDVRTFVGTSVTGVANNFYVGGQGNGSGEGGTIANASSSKLTLAGTGYYTGTTVIGSAANGYWGTVFVTGDFSASSDTQVYNGMVLRGTGTVARTTINAGGIIAPGGSRTSASSMGTLNVNGALSVAGADLTPAGIATMRFQLGTLGATDRISILGGSAVLGNDFTIGDNVTLTLVIPSLASLGSSYTLVTWEEAMTPNSYGTFASITLGTSTSNGTTTNWANSGYSLEYRANSIILVPEPSTMLLMAFAGVALVVFRKRRLAKA